jgi:hypothetical protein
MPRQVLTDEQEVAVKENIIYRLGIQLQPFRHLLATAIGVSACDCSNQMHDLKKNISSILLLFYIILYYYTIN